MSSYAHSAKPLVGSLEEGLNTLFGFDQFRPGQRDVMEAVLHGQNALVVMPTGSGKSLCYQLPACALDGITLVISPLIALMKDQVDALEAKNIPATFINSSISTKEQQDRLFAMEQGLYKVVYVAPERFRNAAFCRAIEHTKIGLFAIDEAHCISSWGHDFRPDYLELKNIRAQLGDPTTIALTATATNQVQRDILKQLALEEADVYVYGFERPNLFFEIFDARSKGAKLERTQALIEHYQGDPTLIYCATRKQVEEVSEELSKLEIDHGIYHGGLSDSERERVQDAFMHDEFDVLIATNAFGMGVDKSNIRAIIHFNIPGSIEAYYQEAGRAGRDGQPSHCLLLFNYADRGIHEFFTDQTYPDKQTIERVWLFVSKLGQGTHSFGPDQIAQQLNRRDPGPKLNAWGVESALRTLQRAAHLEFGTRDGFPWITVHDQARLRDLRVDWSYMQGRRDVNSDLLSDVVRLASGRDCRQLYLLRYFNSRPSFQGGCGHCDACCGSPEYAKQKSVKPAQRVTIKDPVETFIQKALSGVARAKGRFGAHMVAMMLRGAKSKKLQNTSLLNLSTFGLLSYIKQQDLVELLDLLLRYDLLGRDEHGCIHITDAGMEAMRDPDQLPLSLRYDLEERYIPKGGVKKRVSAPAAQAKPASAPTPQPAQPPKPKSKTITRQDPPDPLDAPIRRQEAASSTTRESVPARAKPAAAPPQASPAPARQPLPAPPPESPTLKLDRRAAATPPPQAAAPRAATSQAAKAPPQPLDPSLQDVYRPTLELLQKGKSLDEIAQSRGVKLQTILRHLMVMADRGDRFDLSDYIKPRLLEAIRAAARDWRYGDALATVKEASPACSYDDLKIHLAQILMERAGGR